MAAGSPSLCQAADSSQVAPGPGYSWVPKKFINFLWLSLVLSRSIGVYCSELNQEYRSLSITDWLENSLIWTGPMRVLSLGRVLRAGSRGALGEGGEQRGSQEVAERPSQAPNGKRQATASPSSRNEHARSRASSMGVGVRGDAARSACWFRRLQALAGTCGNSPLGSNGNGSSVPVRQ